MVAHTNKLIIGDVVGAPVLLLPVDYHLGMNNCFSFIGAFPLQLHNNNVFSDLRTDASFSEPYLAPTKFSVGSSKPLLGPPRH